MNNPNELSKKDILIRLGFDSFFANFLASRIPLAQEFADEVLEMISEKLNPKFIGYYLQLKMHPVTAQFTLTIFPVIQTNEGKYALGRNYPSSKAIRFTVDDENIISKEELII